MRNSEDLSAQNFPAAYSRYLESLARKPVTRADMFIGLPLCLVLGGLGIWQLLNGLASGVISTSPEATASWANEPGWFVFGCALHCLWVLFFLGGAYGFVRKFRRQRNGERII